MATPETPKKGFTASALRKLLKVPVTGGEWIPFVTERKPVVMRKMKVVSKKSYDYVKDGKTVEAEWNWNEEFMERHCVSDGLLTVYATRTGAIQAINSARSVKEGLDTYKYAEPHKQMRLTPSQFRRLREVPDRKYKYFQQDCLRPGLGKPIEEECREFVWDCVNDIRQTAGFGDIVSYELCNFEAGVYKQCRYEEQDTIHAQLSGTRRVIVFEPPAYPCLYPYPTTHPCDRISQAAEYIESGAVPGPQFKKLMLAANHAWVADLSPNDVLFLPSYYWIHELSPKETCVSALLWCQTSKPDNVMDSPVLSDSNLVTCRRNIEKLAAERFGGLTAHQLWTSIERGWAPKGIDLKELNTLALSSAMMLSVLVGPTRSRLMLQEMVDGRFSHLEVNDEEVAERLRKPLPKEKKIHYLEIANKV